MNSERREQILKLVAAAAVGLWLLNLLVIDPVWQYSKQQNIRIAALQEKVKRGRQVLSRQTQIQQRWAQMQRANLPAEVSAAEFDASKAVIRWVIDSRTIQPDIVFNRQTHEEGYETLECRVTTTGDQASLGRFIYEMETDSLPVNLEDCELITRDAKGAQLTLTARVTFLRMKQSEPPKKLK